MPTFQVDLENITQGCMLPVYIDFSKQFPQIQLALTRSSDKIMISKLEFIILISLFLKQSSHFY